LIAHFLAKIEVISNPEPAVRKFLVPLLSATLAVSAFVVRATPQNASSDLTVSAAISLKDALNDVQPLFLKGHPGATLHFNLGASGTLQQQIEQGAPVDVYISAAPDQMDSLAKEGMLLDGTRHDLARNSIVLVVPANSSQVSDFRDLGAPAVKFIAIGEPQTVPAGKYAQEVLTHLGLYDSLKPKLVLGKDVRSVLTYVASGNADAAIVYATDARTTSQVKVVATAPEDSHSPVIYPVAVLKGSKSADAAKSFVDFLLSSEGQAIFQKYGFSPAR
jgi:molybdate transport system substrate-binding protein